MVKKPFAIVIALTAAMSVFGSEADMRDAKRHDALHPIADVCSAHVYVCFGQKADILAIHSITSPAASDNRSSQHHGNFTIPLSRLSLVIGP